MKRWCITTSGGVFLLLRLYAQVCAADSIKAACATVGQLCLLLHYMDVTANANIQPVVAPRVCHTMCRPQMSQQSLLGMAMQ